MRAPATELPTPHTDALAVADCSARARAVIKGLALFWMWEMGGSATVFGLVKPFVETKSA